MNSFLRYQPTLSITLMLNYHNTILTQQPSMRRFSHFIQAFDMYPAPITLKSNSITHAKSNCSGSISFMIICLTLFYFVYKVVDEATSEIIVSTKYYEEYSDEVVSYSLPMVGISVDGLTTAEFIKRFTVKFYYKFQQFKAKPCTLEDWKDLPSSQLKKLNFTIMMCPSLIIENQIVDIPLYKKLQESSDYYFKMKIFQCIEDEDEEEVVQCDLSLTNKYLINEQKPEVRVYLFDNKIQEGALNFTASKLNSEVRLHFDVQSYDEAFIYYDSYSVTTKYRSLAFISEEKTQTGYTLGQVEKRTKMVSDIYPFYCAVNIYLSDRILHYQREVNSHNFDQAIALSGGFFVFCLAVFALCLIPYNAFLRDLIVAQQIFKADGTSNINDEDIGFVGYLKYRTYRTLKLFSIDLDKKSDNKRIEENLQQLNYQTDVRRFVENNHQMRPEQNCFSNKSELVCLGLIDSVSLTHSRYKRVERNYLSHIMKDQDPVTIRDLRKMHDLEGLNFLALLSRLSTIKKIPYSEKLIPISAKINSYTSLKLAVQINSSEKVGQESQKQIITDQNPQRQVNKHHRYSRYSKNGRISEFKGKKADLALLDQLLDLFPRLQHESRLIKLGQDEAKAQFKFAKSFYNLKPSSRASLQEGVPIIVLHRLMDIIYWIRYQKTLSKQSGQKIVRKDLCTKSLEDLNFKQKYYEQEQQADFSDCSQSYDECESVM